MSLVVNALLEFANFSTIAFSGFMKIPQVYSLIYSKSAVGVSLIGLMLELTGYCIMMSYNIYSSYPLASYMEYPLLVTQDVIMLLVLLSYLNLLSSKLLLPFTAFSAAMLGIVWGYFPKATITILVNLCTPLSASSKVVQLKSILSSKDSTGVSVISWSLSAYTSIARLFTIYIESFDVALMTNFSVSFLLNLAIVIAAQFYKQQKHLKKKSK